MGSRGRLEEIGLQILRCRACDLWRERKNPVPGEGDPAAEIMLVGEAPGRREDESGRPFVGAAGKVLELALRGAGLSRGEVFITNLVKCRPPGNRDPSPGEVRACSRFLLEQVRAIGPRVIVALGRHSSRFLASQVGVRLDSILRFRGRVLRGRVGGVDVSVIPTIHPAAAIYNPGLRPLLEEDLKGAARLARGGSYG